MTRTTRNRLLIAVVVLVGAALGTAVWWSTRAADPRDRRVVIDTPAVPDAPIASAPTEETPRVTLAAEDPPQFTSLDTTVVYPLVVELELVAAKDVPKADGAPALGSGAESHLSGRITDAGNQGVRAEIRFEAGPNEGRVLYSDRLGNFGAHDLYPGLSVVRITGPGILGSRREVRLRQKRDQLLNVAYSRPGVVNARVIDADGKGIGGAQVDFDGQIATSDDDGWVSYSAVASGDVLVGVSKPGFAAYREVVPVAAGATVERGKLQFALRRGARLVVEVADAINAGQQASVFLLPESPDAQRKFPWYSIDPVRVWPGGSTVVNDLPAGRVALRLFHGGALAKPPMKSVELSPGDSETVTFHLEPGPVVSGVVTDGGSPAAGARVRLEVPDRTSAMAAALGAQNYLVLESDVYPALPTALQEATTTSKGEFSLSSYEDLSNVRYVTAVSSDGKRTASSILRGGETRVDLALQPAQGGASALVVQLEGRYQPLPVKTTVDGAPRDPVVLPPGRDLHVEGLARGSWLVTVSWNGATLVSKQPVEIDDEVSLPVQLPEGAIQGQDEDTRKRVGLR